MNNDSGGECNDAQDFDYEDSLAGALSSQLGSSSWYLSSVAIHAFALLIFLLIPLEQRFRSAKEPPRITDFDPAPVDEEQDEQIEERHEDDPIVVDSNEVIEAPIVVTADIEVSEKYVMEEDVMDDSNEGADTEVLGDEHGGKRGETGQTEEVGGDEITPSP